MNWIDPRVKFPEEGGLYLVLLSFNNANVVFIGTAAYERRYNGKTRRHEPITDKMGWKSLYAPTRTRAVIYDCGMNLEHKKIQEELESLGRQHLRYKCSLETVPHFYPIKYAIAYIAIKDIDYPQELMKSHSNCNCGK